MPQPLGGKRKQEIACPVISKWSSGDSPSKHSTVTVNAMNCMPSVSTTTSPNHRRLISARRQHTGGNEVFGSFRSDGTIGADSQCPVEEEREAAREAAKLFRLENCTKADVAERLNDRYSAAWYSQCPVEEEREAAREAAKLFRLENCTKADVAERLNDRSEFSAMVATKYLELFVFSSLRIDAALREFLSR
ncbi:unnamed protein product [Strongylus vulgaris]|uniref:SEC7 domain-containing protein n=1 Tax=Strongylus vulgaris TaxID=40348 RepID=A0A3P7JF96_STRVU|nr:unnamed protein product [Strongylus vulgaris]